MPNPRPDAQILPKYRGMMTVCLQRGFAPLHSDTQDRPLYFGRIWASGLGVGHGWLTAQTRCIRASDDTPGLRQRTIGQLPNSALTCHEEHHRSNQNLKKPCCCKGPSMTTWGRSAFGRCGLPSGSVTGALYRAFKREYRLYRAADCHDFSSFWTVFRPC